MPLDGSGNYYYPLGTPGVPNQTIESEKYNDFLDDLVMNDLNVARPVSRGGTGASTPEAARTNLGVMSSSGGTMTNSIIVTGTITASTGASAGTIYLGTDGVHYLQWSAGSYWLPAGPLAVGGNTTITGGLGVTGSIAAGGELIVGGTSNTGVVRFGHATANYLYFDSVNYTLAGGSLHVTGGVVQAVGLAAGSSGLNVSGATVLGGTLNVAGAGSFANDVTITRGEVGVPLQGYLFLGNSGRYVGYDGTNYVMPTAGLSVGGAIISGGDVTAANTLIAQNGLVALNATSTRFLQWNGSSYVLPNAHLYVNASAVWTDAYNGVSGYLPLGGGTLSGDLAVTGAIKTKTSVNQGRLWFGDGGHNINFHITNTDAWALVGGSEFHISGSTAVKPGGGSWAAPSDGRIKTVLGEYDHGLDQIKHLKPQRFKYTDRDFDAVKDQEFIGFVAQDVEPVMPEMVSRKNGIIDGKEVKDFRMTDTTALIFALVNAVRELSDRVEELESAG